MAANEAAPSATEFDYLSLPLAFEANRGQAVPGVDFIARGDGYLLSLSSEGLTLELRSGGDGDPARGEGRRSAEVRMRLLAGNALASVAASRQMDGRVNYLRGSDPRKWTTNVPLHERVLYRGVYPGIDVVYYGRQRLLEHDFIIAPDASPSDIVLDFEGTENLRIDASGNLLLAAAGRELRLLRPVAYQESPHGREPVRAGYALEGPRRIRFEVGAYDADRPLIIDPVLTYSSFLAGSNVDEPYDVAVDDDGNAYVVGHSWSFDYPTTPGAFDETCGVAGECGDINGFDAFVTKLTADGSSLLWSTFVGGSSGDIGQSIAVDGQGRVFITGETRSTDFPVTANAIQSSPGDPSFPQDAFVTGIAADGASLFYSSYLGGTGAENHTLDFSGIALDATGRVCVSGVTQSANFPVTAGAFDSTLGGSRDGFVACYEFGAEAPTLTFATFIGGSSFEGPGGIAMDSVGGVYVGGWTSSTDFPTSVGAFDTTPNGGDDAFAMKFDAAGNRVWASLIGGSTHDVGSGLAVDAGGHAYLIGWRASASDFPTTPGAFDTTSGGSFVSKFNTTGTGLVYSTFLGDTTLMDIAVDGSGRASVFGTGWGASFPVTPDAHASTRSGIEDVTFSTFQADGSGLVYSTYLGGANYGSDVEKARGLALDPAGNAYLVGHTNTIQWAETPFPTTPGAFDRQGGEYWSGFVARIGGLGGSNEADLTVSQSDAPDPVSLYGTLTYTVSVTNLGPDEANRATVTESLPANVFLNTASGAGWACDDTMNPVVCSRALLAAGVMAPDLIFEVTPFEAVGTFTATATVSAHENDSDPSNNTASVDSIVDAPDCSDEDGDGYVACYGDCNPPTGLTCGDCGEFDPNTYPGAPEICDFYDNDCDGEFDEGLGPLGFGELSIGAADYLSWSTISGAAAFDLVRGDLNTLRSFGDLSSGSICLGEDLTVLQLPDTEDPVGQGAAFWYLIRGVDPSAGSCGNGSYDSGGTRQYDSRDNWITSWPCQ